MGEAYSKAVSGCLWPAGAASRFRVSSDRNPEERRNGRMGTEKLPPPRTAQKLPRA
jgi:hypothetical protein